MIVEIKYSRIAQAYYYTDTNNCTHYFKTRKDAITNFINSQMAADQIINQLK